jgi:hypothetical protein
MASKSKSRQITQSKSPVKDGLVTEKSQSTNPEKGYEDPLSQVSRSERRNLLISDVTLVALVWGSLVPTKIAALGIDLIPSERYSLIIIVFAISFYFLLAFWCYARVDERVWMIALAEAESAMFEAYSKPDDSSKGLILGGSSDYVPEREHFEPEVFFLAWKKSQNVYHYRRLFDIDFPIAITFLVWAACIGKLIFRGL